MQVQYGSYRSRYLSQLPANQIQTIFPQHYLQDDYQTSAVGGQLSRVEHAFNKKPRRYQGMVRLNPAYQGRPGFAFFGSVPVELLESLGHDTICSSLPTAEPKYWKSKVCLVLVFIPHHAVWHRAIPVRSHIRPSTVHFLGPSNHL